MTDTLAPVEHTNWALSAWNSTLDWNDVPSAWLYGQDHLWATNHLVSSPGEGFPPPSHPPPRRAKLKLMHIFEKIISKGLKLSKEQLQR